VGLRKKSDRSEMGITEIPQRFFDKVKVVESGCHVWTAGKDHQSYGMFQWEGNKWKSHRWYWIAVNGPIKNGLGVLHKCNNSRCVKLDHLYLGTAADNAKDRDSSGRNFLMRHPECALKGESAGMSKLTEDKVRQIRKLSAQGALTIKLSNQFGVGMGQIRKIVRRVQWAHID